MLLQKTLILRLLCVLVAVLFSISLFVYFQYGEKTVQNVVTPIDTYNETEALAARARSFIVFDMPEKRNYTSTVTVLPRIEINPPGVLPPFVGNYTQLVFSKKYNIAACLIPKVMSTVLTGTMCYLQNSTEFVKAGRRIDTEQYAWRFCQIEIERYRMHVFERLYNQEKKFKFITVVRDPIDRFLAAFTDKCYYEAKRVTYEKTVCQEVGCADDLECFIKQMHKRLWGVVTGTHSMNVMDWHVMPMTWTCDMRRYLGKFKFYKYAAKGTPEYIEFLNDFTDTLKERDVPQEKIKHIRDSLTSKNSPHTTTGSSMRSKYKAFIMSRPDLLKVLVDLYYFDYKIFNYPFPKEYNVATKGSQV